MMRCTVNKYPSNAIGSRYRHARFMWEGYW
jgi:hypothetical protein